jgi:hypothetical protein
MVRQPHHERLELPLVLSSSKDALRSNRLPHQAANGIRALHFFKR